MTFLSKQSKLEKAISKWEKAQGREETRKKLRRLHDEAWAKVSAQVCVRDKQTCRICGCQTTRWGVGNPRYFGSAHHIVMRSAGGKDVPENLLWTCWRDHDAIHRHEITVTGTSDNLFIEALGVPR